MNIYRLQYNEKHQALEIYLSGCKSPHCQGCHNSSLWGFNAGDDWETWKAKFYQYDSDMVKNYFIMGGCPIDQDIVQLENLLIFISSFHKSIMLWTRYGLDKVPKNILQHLDYIKTGEYQCDSESYEEPLFGIKLSSKNQSIHTVKVL